MSDKLIWSIDKFDGGINNHADPRDLPINQFVKLTKTAVHRFGKLETLGGEVVLEQLEDKRATGGAGYGANTNWGISGNQFDAADNGRTGSLVTAGTGLYSFSTDINAGGSVSKEDWLLMPDPSGHSIDAFAYQTGAWQNEWIDPGTGTGLKARYLYKDGAIRVSDANGSTGNYVKWKGYITRTRFGTAVNAWTEVVNSLTAPTSFVVSGANTPTNAVSFSASPTNIELIMDTYDDTDAIESEWKKQWEFAASYVYDGNQESLLTKATTTIDLTVSDEVSVSKARFRIAGLTTGEFVTTLKRVSHLKIYMRIVGTKDWLLQAIFDVTDGGGLPYEDAVLGWTTSGNYKWSANTVSTTTKYMTRPLDKYDYEFEAGHPSSIKSVDIAGNGYHWKTAVIANRKAYVANVKRNTEEGDGRNEQDAIYVSLPGQYDKFPSNRKLETVGSDGEEIIRLMLYKDKILEFKEKTLRVINISGEFEFVEDTFYNAGIPRWEAAFETPFGITFGNRLGVWLYRGEGEPINLLKRNVNDKYEKTISLVDWNAFYTQSIMVGYNPTQDQLIVLRLSQSSDAKHCYIYTFASQSWVYSPNALESAASIHSNFITDRNNALVWYYITTAAPTVVNFRYWEDVPIACGASANAIEIETKDIDFGLPGINKYVYRIIVEYKSTSATSLTNNMTVSINGENNFEQTTIGTESAALTGTMAQATSWKRVVYTLDKPILVESIAINIDNDSVATALSINEIKIEYRPLMEYKVI